MENQNNLNAKSNGADPAHGVNEHAADGDVRQTPKTESPVLPRPFALCFEGYDQDAYPGSGRAVDPEIVFAWGLTMGEESFIYRPAARYRSREYGIFSSAERALDLFSRIRPLRLIWL